MYNLGVVLCVSFRSYALFCYRCLFAVITHSLCQESEISCICHCVLFSELLLLLQVCLIVPHHQSMNDGHCLLVPMQHVVQATVVDEDVWDEIKVCPVKQMLLQV